MDLLSRYLENAYLAWLGSAANCCSVESLKEAPTPGCGNVERPMRIAYEQPRLVPPPSSEPLGRPLTRHSEWIARSKDLTSRAKTRGSFSARRILHRYNGSRRPLVIGAPTNFQHVRHSLPRKTDRFRPLELSIYIDRRLSPLMPHFGGDALSFSPRQSKNLEESSHSRNDSSLSFRIPRKPLRSSSRTSSEWTAQFRTRPASLTADQLQADLEKELPQIPQPVRLRAVTTPASYERVKSALFEKNEIERRLKYIEEVIEERRSVYMNSRPSSRATTLRPSSIYSESQEPMPTLEPTLTNRVISPLAEPRPNTAPAKTVHIPKRHKSFSEASATFNKAPASERSLPPPPPLPLVLQAPHPPLRKKKSFSRVSNWLFPEHSRNVSMDSVTNTPKPITSREGFYQCVDLRQQPARTSTVSLDTVSTMESELEDPTIPTTYSPRSSPGRSLAPRTFSLDSERNFELARMETYGEGEKEAFQQALTFEPMPKVYNPGRDSVGVAF